MAQDDDDTGGTEPPKNQRKVAVALEYVPGTERAPYVVASGHGAIAEQILQIAFAKGVKVREDADLAELLAAVDVDTEIPVEAFAAVAEILIYLYRVNNQAMPPVGGGSEDPAPPGR